MLTQDQSIIEFTSGRAIPDRLTQRRDAHYLEYARRMLAVYHSNVGHTRREVHRFIHNIFAGEANCDRRRIDAFCKLLDDAATYDEDRAGAAAALRLRVFAMAAKYHPLVEVAEGIFERDHRETKRLIAAEIGQPWEDIEASLYSDVIEHQRLLAFAGYESPQALLTRYNVAQVQACLYRAERLTIHVRSDFAAVVRYAKLARLLLEISRLSDLEYRIELSGPASVMHETRRYGVNFARFVPALLACRDWSLRAAVRTPWGKPATLSLASTDGLRSHWPAMDEFDSSIEEGFARKFGDEHDGWRLVREGVILHDGQATFVPDFVFRRADGAEVLLEIVGFWTPEYLAKKREVLRRFRRATILLAVPQRTARDSAAEAANVIVYKTALKVDAVLDALRRVCPEVPAQPG